MSVYSRILNQRVTKVEAQLVAQKADDANQLSVFHEVMVEADRVLQPCMWDWILETTEPPQERDFPARIAKMLALYQGWNLVGGWREAPPRYWWTMKGCRLNGETLNTDGLYYFFGCSRAEFDSLAEHIRKEVWDEAVRRVTSVLRDHEASGFYRYEPDVARLHVSVISSCNLPQLLRSHIPARKEQAKGSKEALVAWLNSEHRRQRTKRGMIQ